MIKRRNNEGARVFRLRVYRHMLLREARAALAFYADPSNYAFTASGLTTVEADGGERARAALAHLDDDHEHRR